MCRTDEQVSDLRKFVVLPLSSTFGPRHMHERTLDDMTYVWKYGRPDLIITLTLNPKWIKVQEALING